MNKKGFTLMELITVIAILSILALIFIPNFLQYIPEAGTIQCNKNKEAILMKYKYAIQRDNRKMHDDVYADELGKLARLTAIQDSVLDEMSKKVNCSKNGIYSIKDESTLTTTLIGVECTEHDNDVFTVEEKMYNEIVNGIYKNIEACKSSSTEANEILSCLKNKYPGYSFSYMDDKPVIDGNLYKDENIAPLIKHLSGGQFPLFDKGLFDSSTVVSNTNNETLYIRPKVLKANQEDLILFASTQSGATSWYGVKAVYIDGKWYKSSNHIKGLNNKKIPNDLPIASSEWTIEYLRDQVKNKKLIPINQPYPN